MYGYRRGCNVVPRAPSPYFSPSFLFPSFWLSFSNREGSHQYLVAFLFYLTSEGQNFGCEWAESRLIPRVKMEVSGDLLLVDLLAKVLSFVNKVRLDSGVVRDDTSTTE